MCIRDSPGIGSSQQVDLGQRRSEECPVGRFIVGKQGLDMKGHPTALVESDMIGEGTRVWAYAHVMAGARLGSNVQVGDHSFIEGGAVVGDNVTIKNQVCIWDGVVIADGVFVGPRATFTNDLHPRSPRMPSAEERYSHRENWLATTHVGHGCSIGASATIRAGVSLGPFSMVGAAALVTKDVPPFALVVGVPAKQVADVCQCGQKLSDKYTISCLLYTSPSPRDATLSRMPSSA